MSVHIQHQVPSDEYISFLQLLVRKAMDPYSWSRTIHIASEDQVYNKGETRLHSRRRGHDRRHFISNPLHRDRRKGFRMLIQILGVCECHVCGGGIEGLDAKIIRYHSYRNKAIAREKNLS